MCVQQSAQNSADHLYLQRDGEEAVFRDEGCVCVPVGAAGECMGCSSGGSLDRRFLPLAPCSALLLRKEKRAASQYGGKTREMPVAPDADWED